VCVVREKQCSKDGTCGSAQSAARQRRRGGGIEGERQQSSWPLVVCACNGAATKRKRHNREAPTCPLFGRNEAPQRRIGRAFFLDFFLVRICVLLLGGVKGDGGGMDTVGEDGV
jgi:hypothetical protein